MPRNLLPVFLMLLLFTVGCARFQDVNFSIPTHMTAAQKYRLGTIESKHAKELEDFLRANYSALITANEDAPVINVHLIHLNTYRPGFVDEIVAALALGFISRNFSVDVRCILQIANNKQIITESKAESSGRVMSWGYFAHFMEGDRDWAIGPAELEAEKRAFALAVDKFVDR